MTTASQTHLFAKLPHAYCLEVYTIAHSRKSPIITWADMWSFTDLLQPQIPNNIFSNQKTSKPFIKAFIDMWWKFYQKSFTVIYFY